MSSLFGPLHSKSDNSGLRIVRSHGRFDISEGVDNVLTPTDEEQENEEYLGVAISPGRINGLFIIILVLFGTLIARSAYLQILSGDEYRLQAEQNRMRILPVRSERGVFFDKNNTPLVYNIPSFSLTITPADLPRDEESRDKIFSALGELLEQDADLLSSEYSDEEGPPLLPVRIAERLTYDQAMRVMIAEENLSGVDILVDTARLYELGDEAPESLGHIFGYLGKITSEQYTDFRDRGYLYDDDIGRTGIEASLEDEFRGKYGSKRVEVDVFGREQRVIAGENPVDGISLRLTLDLEAQAELESALKRALNKLGKRRASAVALDPRDGSVIALVSLPGFDANVFAQGVSTSTYNELISDPDRPLFPRAVLGTFPSGSTIKPVVAAAALQEGVITENTTVRSVGGIWYADRWFFPDWKYGGHGITDVKKAIAESVNTFFYIIGGGTEETDGLGIDRLAKYFRMFQLGAPTGVELPSEASGLVPTPEWKKRVKGEEWYIGDTYHAAIGQGDVLVTPLQLAMITQPFANGGTIYGPRLVAAEKLINGGELNREPRILNEQVVAPSVIEIVRNGMRQTVTNGSAPLLQLVPVPVAGKTGTAQWNTKKKPHAWFTGFAPFDEPEIVITVLVEEAGEGSEIAVPVAQDFLSWYFGVHNP